MYDKLKFISSSSQENTVLQNLRDSHQESISSPLQLFFQKNIHSIILPEKIDPEMIRQTAHSFSMPISKGSDINEDIYYVVPKEKLLFINSSKKMPIEKPQKVAISRDSLLKLLDLLTEHSEDHGYLFFKEIIDHFQQKFHLTNNSETTISFFNSQINHKQIKQIIDFFEEKSVTEVPEKKNIKENYSVFIEIISALLLYLDYGNLTQTLSFDRLYKLLTSFYGGKVTNNEKNEIIIKLNHFFLQEWLNSIRYHIALNAEQIRFLNFFIYVNQIEEEKFALLMKGTVINDNDQVTKRLTFQIKKQLITNDSFLNYRLCVFDPYRTFLHNYHIDPQRFCIISNKPDLLFSKIKVISNYASVLLNPKNDYFDFNHIWNNKLIKRNNVISVFKRDNQKRFIPHYLVLKYYPVFYNALKQYCLRETVYPYYSIKGSPGTGKTTMLIYIVLRWYQQQDLFNQNHELIDTIMIKPSKQNIINAFLFFQLEKDVFKFGIIVKDYWHHFNCDHTPIVMYLVDRNTNQSILYDENNPILATKKIRIDYEKALYIFDEYEDPVYGSDFKRLILNSIGSKKRNKDIETETSIFTFLPSMEEMKMLKKLIKDSSDKQHFKETMTLVGSNIRKCISKEAIKNLIKEGIERFSDRHHFSEQLELMLQPEKYLLTESSQYSVNSTLIQITSYCPTESELDFYMNYCNFSQFRNRFNRYSVIFSSKYILDLVQTRYDELFHKHIRLKYGSIPNDLYFQNIRAFQMVNGFHLLISKTRLISFETRNICYIFKNNIKHKDKKIFDSLDKYHLHNFELDHVDVVEDLDDLFCIDVLNNTASISIYFQPPTSNQECYDSVLLEKNQDKISVILFQLTISAEHYFNIFYFMIFVEKYMKCKQEIANCIWDIEFWVVTPNIGIPFKFTSIIGFDDNMKFIRSQCRQIKKVFKKLKYTFSDNSKSVTARKKRVKCDKKNLFGQKLKDRIEATKLFCELTQRITFRFSGIITSIKSE